MISIPIFQVRKLWPPAINNSSEVIPPPYLWEVGLRHSTAWPQGPALNHYTAVSLRLPCHMPLLELRLDLKTCPSMMMQGQQWSWEQTARLSALYLFVICHSSYEVDLLMSPTLNVRNWGTQEIHGREAAEKTGAGLCVIFPVAAEMQEGILEAVQSQGLHGPWLSWVSIHSRAGYGNPSLLTSLQAAPLQVLSTTLSRSSLYLPIAGQMFPNNALHVAGSSCGALMLSVLSGPLSTALLLGYPPATCRLTGNLVL